MQFLYDKQVVVKRYSSTLGEFNRPNKTLVEVGTYECHTAESSTTTAQLQPQKKNTTDLTLYTDPEAPIKRGDILYIYELDEYDKPSGYAKGTPGVDRDQIAIVDEEGRELQIPNGKGGRITKLEKGTGVIPHTATEKLMALSEQLDNNGNMVINGRTIEEYVNDMANMQSIAVPDFSDVTASVVSQLEGKGMGNVTVEYNQPVTFNSVDKNDIPQMEEFLKRAREDTTKYIVKELRKGGMQIRR